MQSLIKYFDGQPLFLGITFCSTLTPWSVENCQTFHNVEQDSTKA